MLDVHSTDVVFLVGEDKSTFGCPHVYLLRAGADYHGDCQGTSAFEDVNVFQQCPQLKKSVWEPFSIVFCDTC